VTHGFLETEETSCPPTLVGPVSVNCSDEGVPLTGRSAHRYRPPSLRLAASFVNNQCRGGRKRSRGGGGGRKRETRRWGHSVTATPSRRSCMDSADSRVRACVRARDRSAVPRGVWKRSTKETGGSRWWRRSRLQTAENNRLYPPPTARARRAARSGLASPLPVIQSGGNTMNSPVDLSRSPRAAGQSEQRGERGGTI